MSQKHLQDKLEANDTGNGRRDFIKQSSLLTALALAPPALINATATEHGTPTALLVPLSIEINGVSRQLSVEPRTTLLDLLREQLAMTGTKKGCDHGQCGACTVHVDGKRVLSCMSLCVMLEGKKVTTIDGVGTVDNMHPVQAAFIIHDGFQCGYCTPGQIMSGIACIREGHANSDEEIREYMSGNICRCGAYPNIVKAIAAVKKGGEPI